MPINAHPDYIAAEGEYHKAQTDEERIEKLKKMISLAPGHKGAENLRAQLKTRLKKLLEKKEKIRRGAKKTESIRKEEMQAVLIGKTNSGKSTLLKTLTNVEPKIAPTDFTTQEPLVGMMPYEGMQVQLIEVPAVDSDYFDTGLANTADVLLLVVQDLGEREELEGALEKAPGKRLVVCNDKETRSANEERKREATLKSKKIDYIAVNPYTKKGIPELKEKLFSYFGKIRVYTKEPGKKPSNKPVVLDPGATVHDVAEKIFHGFARQVKQAIITGPSAKFVNQQVGLKHKVKDKDIIEFKAR